MKASASLKKIIDCSIRLKNRTKGITMRMAILSWLVGLLTLLIFVVITVPQQKNIFLQNLESKSNSVAASLHDAAAGAAVNEDYASVVTAAQTMLAGDPALEFLVVTKNEGIALIIEKNSWRMEPGGNQYWQPEKRSVVAKIATVPLEAGRVFYYAQPFDYSGIQWGWIHVGLSLSDYDKNVQSLYYHTLVLALVCMVISFLISLWYTKRLLSPILLLRHVVQRIADGDLSLRANVIRKDELGSLATSVNVMTDAIVQRNKILESVRFAAEKLVRSDRWEDVIPLILARIGDALDVSRTCIFQNYKDDSGQQFCSLRHEWTAQGISAELHNQQFQKIYYDQGLENEGALLSQNKIISGLYSGMSAAVRAVLDPLNIRSFAVIPIYVANVWWGFIGLADCLRDRVWSDAENDSLRACSEMFGATVARQSIQDALLEAKNTLENRVLERTSELNDQVIAKEQAFKELAAAQSKLLEVSRAAGMAEVATGVLHNVGNVLNSINVSCTLITDQLQQSRVGNISKLADMMNAPEGGLAHFLTEDPWGRQIPQYLATLAPAIEEERQLLLRETSSLQERVDHIKEIVAMQQSYGRVSGVQENITPERLMEDALTLSIGALTRHAITVQRQYEPVPSINVDKHKVLQILLNLINNAKYACTESGRSDKSITLRVLSPGHNRVQLQVEDNGVGILPEDMSSIFRHGFTTRQSGHGFGLHSGALATRELGGILTFHSDGPGAGAVFTLELPRQAKENI